MTGGSGSHDLVIVGGGAAGLGAARAARWAGADVVMVNDGPIGGDCTFTGCVPSKTLIAAARAGDDLTTALDRVHATVERIAATESADVLRAEGIGIVEGRARFVAPDTLQVDGRRLRAPRVIVATGARAFVPPIPGLDAVDALTNETVFDLADVPRSLGIVGGGAIGCELAQAFARFGVDVTVFEAEPRLLPREEPEASEVIAAALTRDGVKVRVGRPIAAVARTAAGVEVATGDGDVTVEQLLVAVGRAPNTAGLGWRRSCRARWPGPRRHRRPSPDHCRGRLCRG